MSTHFFLGICFTLSLRIDTRIQARKRLRNHSVMQFEYEGAPNKQLGSKSMIPSDLRGTECARVFALLGMHKNSSSEAWSKIRSTSKGKAKTSSLSKLTFSLRAWTLRPLLTNVHINRCTLTSVERGARSKDMHVAKTHPLVDDMFFAYAQAHAANHACV